ncbi:MAG: hypothetical protein IPH13_09605 [Planctomycetes bacterium]|nr:hypothetical protein [Planctomycetota bacterium]MCC7172991.1 hypothetical protein [Planctomycetota bacterium]
MNVRREIVRGFVLCVAIGLPACEMPEVFRSDPSGVPFVLPGYARRAPIEVAMLPIQRIEAFEDSDTALLREELYRVLLSKSYTPVAPEYSDPALAPVLPDPLAAPGQTPEIAALNRALDTDGFLTIRMITAERKPARDVDIFRLRGRAVLYDAEGGTILFDHELDLSFEVTPGTSKTLSGSELKKTIASFANRLLGPLPARKSSPPGVSES